MSKLGKNGKVMIALVGCVAMMVGVAFASVPLYRAFCSATGFGGTTQRVAVNTAPVPATDRYVTVTFDGNVDSKLPWDFGPDQKSIRLKLGEEAHISYHARNNSDKTLTGTATYNVQPDKAGSYFDKIQCFCFNKQTLGPHESAKLDVQFYVDPDIMNSNQTSDVKDITLSYTFFLAKEQDKQRPASITPTAKTTS